MYWTNHRQQHATYSMVNQKSLTLHFVTSSWGVREGQDKVFVPSLFVHLAELTQRITAAIDGFDSDTLTRVWAEMGYRVNVCRVIQSSHIEHL
ncbi:hypothetical protein TNCV_2048401 [Trichonephila clavipes]|nr:hypothetical protein TNCV_2048401 [Trichonephila clavipes]